MGFVLAITGGVACTDADPEDAGGLPPEVVEEIHGIVDQAASRGAGGVLAYIDTPTGAVEVASGMPDGGDADDEGSAAFRVASITKLFTSAVVFQLVEEGALSLHDPVAEVLPDRTDAFEFGDELTVSHLLGHTSGLPDYLRNPAYWFELMGRGTIGDGAVTTTCADLEDVDPIAFVAGEASFPPGTDFAYSNAGYTLAGEVIEELTGQPLEAVYRERIIGPLELDRTWLACADDPRAELVPGYHAPGSFGITIPGQGDEPFDVTGVDDPNLWAAAGLVSTPADMADFARALFGGELFDDAATLDRMLETTEDATYGLGVRLGDGTFGHDGLAPGYGTHLRYDPESDTVVTVVVNETSTDRPGEVGSAIRGVLEEAETGT